MKDKARKLIESTVCDLSELADIPEISMLLDSMSESLLSLDLPYTVEVLGEVKAGKSAFINALLNREVSPEDINEKTGNIIRLRYGAPETIVGYYDDKSITISEDEFNLAASGGGIYGDILFIDKVVDSGILKELILMDSPGLNSIKQFAAEKSMDQVCKCDLVLFVFRSFQLGKLTEQEVIEKVRARGRRLVAVINKEDRSENIEKQKEECRRKFGNYFDEVYSVTSVPFHSPRNMEQVRFYIESAKADERLKTKSIVDRNCASLKEINRVILERLEWFKNNNSQDVLELLKLDIDDIASQPNTPARVLRKKALLADRIDCAIDEIANKLIRHVSKYVDSNLTTLGSLKAITDGGGGLELHILPSDLEVKRIVSEFGFAGTDIERNIPHMLANAADRAQEVISDNIRELLTEVAKEAATMIAPKGKIGKLARVLPFLHRVNISPIEEKKLFLKTALRESICKEMKKVAVMIKSEALGRISDCNSNDVDLKEDKEPSDFSRYKDAVITIQNCLNNMEELRRELL